VRGLPAGHGGLVEVIEVLKVDVAFLYDLSGAWQDHKVKPKKFAQTDIDEVILGHERAGISPAAEQRVHGRPRVGTVRIDR
jgi:serine protein kinase